MKRSTLYRLYFFGLLLLVAALPLSKFLLSVSQFLLLGTWLASGDFSGKWRLLRQRWPLLLVASVFLLHLFGLLYTADLSEGLHDLRIKLPLFVLPLIIGSMPVPDKKQQDQLMLVFSGALVLASLRCLYNYYLPSEQVTDIRQVTGSLSHIRLGLMTVLAFIFLIYKGSRPDTSYRILYFLLAVWMVFFLFFLQSLTAIIVWAMVSVFALGWFIWRYKSLWPKVLFFTTLLISGFLLTRVIYEEIQRYYQVTQQVDLQQLEPFTPRGNPYQHDPELGNLENGYYVGLYNCWVEMEEAWGLRSRMDFYGPDKRGNGLRFTLQRYLTSKELRKDYDGVMALDEEDIRLIEKGVANCRYPFFSGLRSRLYALTFEVDQYRKYRDPSGHSLTQRFEFWKAASAIILQHPICGVGTGDMPAAFAREYDRNGTLLREEFRLRSHNQFLAITVAFGLFGLIWFLCALLAPLLYRKYRNDFLFVSFFLIVGLSMLNEDTLETQVGVTFFVLFFSLFLVWATAKEPQNRAL